jgi:hypothetical protein
MVVSVVEWLTSDLVTSAILTVGDPACGFLIAYAAATRLLAMRKRVQPGDLSYFLAAAAGVGIALSGQAAALQLSSVVAAVAPPGDPDGTAATTWLGISVLWPLAWCLTAFVVLLVTWRRLIPPGRRVVAALAIGLLFSLLTFVGLFDLGNSLSLPVRLPFLLALLAVSIVLLVLASPRSRFAGRDRAAG